MPISRFAAWADVISTNACRCALIRFCVARSWRLVAVTLLCSIHSSWLMTWRRPAADSSEKRHSRRSMAYCAAAAACCWDLLGGSWVWCCPG